MTTDGSGLAYLLPAIAERDAADRRDGGAVTSSELTEQIRAIHACSRCTYGAPRILAELRELVQRSPPSVRDFVPEGHLAHFVRDLVREELDLSAVYARRRQPKIARRISSAEARRATLTTCGRERTGERATGAPLAPVCHHRDEGYPVIRERRPTAIHPDWLLKIGIALGPPMR